MNSHNVFLKALSIYSCDGNFFIRTSGWSMEPLIHSGDQAEISRPSENLHVGQLILYQRDSDSRLVLHRIVKTLKTRGGIGYITRGDASPFYDAAIIYSASIVGIVVRIKHLTGKETVCSSLLQRIYGLLISYIPFISFFTYRIKPKIRRVKRHIRKHATAKKRM